jgi:hypothetical protein
MASRLLSKVDALRRADHVRHEPRIDAPQVGSVLVGMTCIVSSGPLTCGPVIVAGLNVMEAHVRRKCRRTDAEPAQSRMFDRALPASLTLPYIGGRHGTLWSGYIVASVGGRDPLNNSRANAQ